MLALMALIVVTTASRTPILQSPDRDPNLHIRHAKLTALVQRPSSSSAPTNSSGDRPSGLYQVLGNIILFAIIGALLLVVLWVTVAVVRSVIRRWRHRRRVQHDGPPPEVDDAVLDAVTEAAGRQQSLILEGTPSNAIVACWVDLEQAVAQVGVARRPSETSAELTIRVLDALDVDRRALRTLGALYREARFSAHPSTEPDRAAAQEALSVLYRSLLATAKAQV